MPYLESSNSISSASAAPPVSATADLCPRLCRRCTEEQAGGRGGAQRKSKFRGRINPLVRANYLASPPLVVAYALAGRWISI